MYCPQCGTESGSGLQYCRLCGANLKVIGKALTLSEAIARSDRGPLPRLKEMVKNLKVEHVTEEVSSALERMNKEILRTSASGKLMKPLSPSSWIRRKTPEERRENHLVKGIVSMFSGVGLMIFLYYLSAALVLKLPPDVLAEIPFELDPVVKVVWLVGLIPTLSGLGRILAGLMVRPARPVESATNLSEPFETPSLQGRATDDALSPRNVPASVTDHTTHLLKPPEPSH